VELELQIELECCGNPSRPTLMGAQGLLCASTLMILAVSANAAMVIGGFDTTRAGAYSPSSVPPSPDENKPASIR
jgi:hypothetical protein